MLTGSPNLNIENIDFSNQKRYEGSHCPHSYMSAFSSLTLYSPATIGLTLTCKVITSPTILRIKSYARFSKHTADSTMPEALFMNIQFR
jgi:hypothetical protein